MNQNISNLWNERYQNEEFVYGTAPNEFLAATAAAIPTGGDVLCLGEGEGRNAVFLAEQGYRVTAIDASAVGLAKARQLAAQRGVAVTTIVADLAEYRIAPGAWSGIVSIFCHLPPLLRAAVHQQAVTGLAPGGVLLLEAYTPRQLDYRTGGPPQLELLVEPDELRRELAGLDLRRCAECVREIHEGTLHNGISAVVQVVGMKR